MSKIFETPKGTRDFLPAQMRLRRVVFDRLRRAFELYGFEELDTPAFEYLEVLTLKSGPAAENEIYSFEDRALQPRRAIAQEWRAGSAAMPRDLREFVDLLPSRFAEQRRDLELARAENVHAE